MNTAGFGDGVLDIGIAEPRLHRIFVVETARMRRPIAGAAATTKTTTAARTTAAKTTAAKTTTRKADNKSERGAICLSMCQQNSITVPWRASACKGGSRAALKSGRALVAGRNFPGRSPTDASLILISTVSSTPLRVEQLSYRDSVMPNNPMT